MHNLKIALCVGESSGDNLGLELIKDLKNHIKNIEIIGVGGPLLEKEGLKSLFKISEISYMGLIDPLLNLKKILKKRKELIDYIKKEKPDLFIGIDSPSFNSGICKTLKRETNIKTIQYVCPQFWAWRYGRVKKFNDLYDRVFSLFPFESNLLKKHNVVHSYVGHPLAKKIPLDINKDEYKAKLGLDKKNKIISLLPGSRKSEINYHYRPICDAVNLFNTNEDISFILAVNKETTIPKEFLKYTPENLRIIKGKTQDVLAASDFALVTSGTATLEAALFKSPMIVIYRSNSISNFILSNFFLRTKYISLPNVLTQKNIVKEIRQKDVNGLNIHLSLRELMTKRNTQKENFINLHKDLIADDKNKFINAIKETLSK